MKSVSHSHRLALPPLMENKVPWLPREGKSWKNNFDFSISGMTKDAFYPSFPTTWAPDEQSSEEQSMSW